MKKLTTLMVALFVVAGISFAQSNETTITQSSNNNSANVDQAGMDNIATIVQTGGNQNSATIRQSSDPAEDGVIESIIRQNGFNNTAVTNGSRKNSASSITEQVQNGNNNRAYINPAEGSSPGGNEGTTLTQVQIGNQNYATMDGSDSYRAEQYQNGFSNVAKTSGNGKNGDVYQRQVGNNNFAEANGLSFANSEQLQFGNENISDLDGIGHDGPGESYYTRQNGNSNTALLFANGNGGVLDIVQTNNQNYARVNWTTVGNSTTISQNGYGNDAIVNSN